MPLIEATMRSSSSWTLRKTNTGFGPTTHKDDQSGSLRANVATHTQAYVERHTLTAAGTVTINFNSFTSKVNEAVTATKFKGIHIVVSAAATGGELKIEPGGSDPFALGLAGTTPSITLAVGTEGAEFLYKSGTDMTLSTTVKNLLLTNTGSVSIDVDVFALIG